MRNSLLLIIFTGIFLSCKNSVNEHQQHTDSTVEIIEGPEGKPIWKIYGNEPFWGIYIHEDTAIYSRLNDKIDSVYLTIHHYSDQDSIVEFHLMDREMNEAGLVIRRGPDPCSDGMSDKHYEYSAKFIYQKEALTGCAEQN